MPDLAEFLLARIAEDVQFLDDVKAVGYRLRGGNYGEVARIAIDAIEQPEMVRIQRAYSHHPVPSDIQRLRSECEAKRYVVRMCAEVLKAFDDREGGMWPDVNRRERSHAHAFLAHLALPYADHPDYDEEWSPASRVERGVR